MRAVIHIYTMDKGKDQYVKAAIGAWRSAMMRPADQAFRPAAGPMWTQHVSFIDGGTQRKSQSLDRGLVSGSQEFGFGFRQCIQPRAGAEKA